MNRTPKRVLHVVRAMNRGGVETWLMQLLRRVDPRALQMHFLVHTQEPADFDREIADAGSQVVRCKVSWRSPVYGWKLRALLERFGPYDAVHSHVHHFSGLLLGIARAAGVGVRIAHSHSDTSRQDSNAPWLRRQYLRFARTQVACHATHWLAASQAAGKALFGARWETDARSRVLHCGIDLNPFRRPGLRELVRQRLEIAADELVVGHVGRLDTPKNHDFLVEAAVEASRLIPRLRLVLVGDGPARPHIEQRTRELGIASRTLFLGTRADVPDLLSAMDVFVFPSLWEGLPLSVMEAQAAGLPCLISDAIPAEAVVAPGLVQCLPLAAGAVSWAEAIVTAGRLRGGEHAALETLEENDFNIERSLEALYALYGA